MYSYCRVLLYFLLFGLAGEPFLELMSETPSSQSGNRVRIFKDKSGTYHCSSSTNYNATGPMPINPDTVRQEVSVMKTDVNMRARQVMFNTLIGAYYAAFVPCCFVQSALNYELWWVFKHGVLVFIGGGILYIIQVFPAPYLHMLHRTAVKLGQWTRTEGRMSHNFYAQWTSGTVWPFNTFVRHGKYLYKGT